MTDLVYPPIIGSARAAFLMLGLKFTVVGAQNVPTTGGAVLASNHVSYLDFIFVGLGADDSSALCDSWQRTRCSRTRSLVR